MIILALLRDLSVLWRHAPREIIPPMAPERPRRRGYGHPER